MLSVIKICQVRAELFYAERERERDMTKLIAAIHNFANVPKNGCPTKCNSHPL